MHVKVTVTDTVYEAQLSDRLSFSDNSAFRKLLNDMLASKARHWVLDLSTLVSVDSAGLGMFIIALDAAKKAGLSLTLRSPTGHVKNLIELSKMDKLITVEG
jgi:HptB-dependent secretion and biofilm anti anti-sigma factor